MCKIGAMSSTVSLVCVNWGNNTDIFVFSGDCFGWWDWQMINYIHQDIPCLAEPLTHSVILSTLLPISGPPICKMRRLGEQFSKVSANQQKSWGCLIAHSLEGPWVGPGWGVGREGVTTTLNVLLGTEIVQTGVKVKDCRVRPKEGTWIWVPTHTNCVPISSWPIKSVSSPLKWGYW